MDGGDGGLKSILSTKGGSCPIGTCRKYPSCAAVAGSSTGAGPDIVPSEVPGAAGCWANASSRTSSTSGCGRVESFSVGGGGVCCGGFNSLPSLIALSIRAA